MTTTTQTIPNQSQWDAANTFLGELIINPNLSQDYLNITQQANGQENAKKILNNWLRTQGYNTTPNLIYAALVALQNTSLDYWIGVYEQSFQKDEKGQTIAAPILAILLDSEGNPIPYLNGVVLKNVTFKTVINNNVPNLTLTWDFNSNTTAGNIIFYNTPSVNANPDPPQGYTGNWFQGTLQTAENASPQSFFGGLGDTTNLTTTSQAYSTGEFTSKTQDFWEEYKGYVITIATVTTLGVLGFIVYHYLVRQWAINHAQEQVQEQDNEWRLIDENSNEFGQEDPADQQHIRYQDDQGNIVNHHQQQPVNNQENSEINPDLEKAGIQDLDEEEKQKVLQQRRNEYERNLKGLANKAKRVKPNMTKEQAEQWLLSQSLVFDPDYDPNVNNKENQFKEPPSQLEKVEKTSQNSDSSQQPESKLVRQPSQNKRSRKQTQPVEIKQIPSPQTQQSQFDPNQPVKSSQANEPNVEQTQQQSNVPDSQNSEDSEPKSRESSKTSPNFDGEFIEK